MKLAVKTLKGEKFDVIVESDHTISQVKGIIVRVVCISRIERDGVYRIKTDYVRNKTLL